MKVTEADDSHDVGQQAEQDHRDEHAVCRASQAEKQPSEWHAQQTYALHGQMVLLDMS